MGVPPAVVPLCRTGVAENFTCATAEVAMRLRNATARMPGCLMSDSRKGKEGALTLRRWSHAVNACEARAFENGVPPNGPAVTGRGGAGAGAHPRAPHRVGSETRRRQAR